jgi:uncharacterized membrane protein YcaP (DUF421 family)
MEIVVRATIVYFLIFILMRGMKKRALAELSPFEMVMVVTFGDIVQQGVTQEDYSLTGVVLATGTFAFWITAMTRLSWRSDKARRIIEGVPLVLVEDGKVIDQTLALEQMPIAELQEAARQQGIADLASVRLAILEPSGKISFIEQPS